MLPDGPKGLPIVGSVYEFRENRLPFLLSLPAYGDIAFFRLGFEQVYSLHHPDFIRQVFIENPQQFQKLRLTRNLFRRTIKPDVQLRKTTAWQERRELVQEALHTGIVAQYLPAAQDLTSLVLKRWQDSEIANIYRELRELTLRIAARTLFGAEIGGEIQEVMQASSILQEKGSRRFNSLFLLPFEFPTPNNLRIQRGIKNLHRVVDSMIQQALASDEDNLIKKLSAVQTKYEQEDDQNLHEELISLLMSSHETTATALSWLCYLLAKNPDVQNCLYQEIRNLLGERPIQSTDTDKFSYAIAVIHEALRLFPPSWVISRKAVENVSIGSYAVPKGATIFVSPYSLHRDKRWFTNPEQFQLERFLSHENMTRYSFLPFGTGPRKCIGSNFAMMEILVILITIVQHFHLETSTSAVEAEALISLRPKQAISLRLNARNVL